MKSRYTIKGDTLQVPIALLGTHEASRNTGSMGVPIKKVPGELAFNYFHEFGRPASRKKLLDKAPFTLKHPWASLGIGAGAGAGVGSTIALMPFSRRARAPMAVLGGSTGLLIGMLASSLRTNSNAREYLKKLHRQGKLKEGNWKAALPVIGVTTAIGAGLGAVPVPTGKNKKEKRNDRIRNILGGAAIGGLVGGLGYLRYRTSMPSPQYHIPAYTYTPPAGSSSHIPFNWNIPFNFHTPMSGSPHAPRPKGDWTAHVGKGGVNPPPIDPGVAAGGIGAQTAKVVEGLKNYTKYVKKPENIDFTKRHGIPLVPANKEEAKKIFFAQSLKLHPDRGGSAEDASRLGEWKAAVEDLFGEKLSSIRFESFLDELIKSS